jgi:hypothetical protein
MENYISFMQSLLSSPNTMQGQTAQIKLNADLALTARRTCYGSQQVKSTCSMLAVVC